MESLADLGSWVVAVNAGSLNKVVGFVILAQTEEAWTVTKVAAAIFIVDGCCTECLSTAHTREVYQFLLTDC